MPHADHCRHASFFQRGCLLLLAALLLGGIPRPGAAQGPAAVAFRAPITYDQPVPAGLERVGGNPLVAADLDGDGRLDLVVITKDGLSILYGNGDGTLASAVDEPLGSGLQEGVVADVNGDGLPDLVFCHFDLGKVVVLLNQGGRQFASPTFYAAPGGPVGITAADFNGDGRLDLAVSCHLSGDLLVLLNRGGGAFLPPVGYGGISFPGVVLRGDWNGDGRIDLAQASLTENSVRILLGDGTGKFTEKGRYPTDASYAARGVGADFNGDSIPDLAIGCQDGISVLFGDGTGGFGPAIRYNGFWLLGEGDFDGDGAPDLVAAGYPVAGFSIYLNRQAGNFLPPVISPGPGDITRAIVVGDFNGDGRPDVVASNDSSPYLAVFLNNGVAPPAGGAGNLLLNGSFEEPDTSSSPLPWGYAYGPTTDPSAATYRGPSIPGWRITRGTIDVLSKFWPAADGWQSIDLVGSPGAGTIEQSFSTEIGREYVFSGYVSHNPGVPYGQADVSLNGTPFVRLTHNLPTSGTEMKWQSFSYRFRAVAVTTTLSISDSTGIDNGQGTALDGLSVALADSSSPPAVPAAPTTLAASAVSPTQINLSWTDNSDDETGFEIQRMPAGGDWTKITTGPANTSSFADGSLGGGLHFSYRVRAIGPGGASDWSNEATVDVSTVAGIGVDLKARGFGTIVVGRPSPAQSVTLTNTGAAPLVINGLTLSGANPADFTVTPSATTVAPGDKITISIVFNPATPGTRSAVLTIDTSAPVGPQTLGLSGTGTGPAGPVMMYTITDLGTLGGLYSHAAAINTLGQVVGNADSAAGPRGFLYDSGGMHDLGTLGGPASYATGLNNRGQIVGYSNITGNTAVHAVVWDGTGIHDLGVLGGSDGEAWAINDAGLIGGSSTFDPPGIGSGRTQAFLVMGGAMQAITTPANLNSIVRVQSVNAAGQALVSAVDFSSHQWHSYLYQDGKTGDLGVLSSQFSVGSSINDSGQIVGLISAAGARFGRAFLADAAGVHDLGALGGTDSQAFGINNLGQVVGSADVDAAGTSHPFLYSGGVMIDLSNLILGAAPWEQFVPYGINDRGQIIGDGITGVGTSHYQSHAYLLTPDPAIPFAAPAAPSGLTVKMVSNSELDLTWTDTSNDERAFELQVKKTGGDWTGIGTVPANTSTFAHTGLPSYAHFSYRVRAVNGAGASDWSNEAGGDTGQQAHAEFSPSSDIDFGNQPVAVPTSPQAMTITNTGNAPMTIGGVTVTGANASEFAIDGPGAAGKTLAPGESVSLSLVFTPAAPGACSAALTITADAPDKTHTMTLRGAGVGPTVRLNPAGLDFGRQLLGTTHGSMPVLIQNSGNAPLSIKSVTVAGANASDFSLAADGCSGGTLKPGDVCSMSVQFLPGAAGSRSASLVIVDDGPGGSQTVPLVGEGIAPMLSLSADQLAFEAQQVGTASGEQSFTLANSGTAPFTVRSGRISGPNAADFVLLTALNGITLDPGESRTISLRFTPAAAGNCAAVLTLITDATAAPVTVKLGGTGTAPLVRLNPSALEFGEQPVGATSEPKPLVIRNAGTAPLDLRTVTISGPNAAEFVLDSDGATGARLNPGEEARLTVRFTAAASGRRTAVLTLTDSAAGGAQTVALGGTGMVASLSISPTALEFGPQPVGTAGTAQTLLLQNTGDVPMLLSSVTLAGADPADFPITADGWSGAQLQPGQVVAVNVRFSPTAPGARGAVLTVLDSATGSPHSVALTGTGTEAAARLDSDSLSFSDQLVGTTSAEHVVTLTNSGTAPLSLVAVTVAGAHASDFNAALDAGSTIIDPGASAAIHVRFRPTAAGPRSASLVITDSGADSPHSIALSGTGTAPSVTFGISRLSGPGSVSFGNQPLATPSATQTLTLTNSGTAALAITGISLTGAAAADYEIVADSGGASLAPGAARTITLRFTATALGGRSASLTIKDNAAGGSQSVNLTGAGVLPAPGTKGLVLPMSAALVAAVDGVPASGPKVIVSVGQTVTLKLLLKYKSGAVADVTTDPGSRYGAVPARGKFTGVGAWTAQAADAARTTVLTGTWTVPGSRRRFAGSLTVTVRAVRKTRR